MIVNINQTRSGTAMEFDVFINGILACRGRQSAMSGMLSNSLQDLSGQVVFSTKDGVADALKGGLPLLGMPTGGERVRTVVDANGGAAGILRYITVGAVVGVSRYYAAQYEELPLKLYTVHKGLIEYILVFCEGRQIGQISKSNLVENNLDKYTLYLLDEFKYGRLAEFLALFAIYYDGYEHANRGEAFSGTKKTVEYSYSQFNKLYDPQWLVENFGIEEEKVDTSAFDRQFKRRAKWLLITIGVSFLVIFIVVVLVFRPF